MAEVAVVWGGVDSTQPCARPPRPLRQAAGFCASGGGTAMGGWRGSRRTGSNRPPANRPSPGLLRLAISMRAECPGPMRWSERHLVRFGQRGDLTVTWERDGANETAAGYEYTPHLQGCPLFEGRIPLRR